MATPANHRRVDLTLPVDHCDQLTDLCQQQQISRRHLLQEIVAQYLGTIAPPTFDRTHFLKAANAVMRITNGKLTRHEAEHVVALVVRTMSHAN